MAMKKLKITFFLLFIVVNTFGQQTQNFINNWHFGDAIGLNFNSGNPVATASSVFALEACTGYSDGDGNLLFYAAAANSSSNPANGGAIWDATHTFMPGSVGFALDFSATSGATAAPIPGSCDQYYIFHISSTGSGWGLYTTTIDMSLPGNGTAAAPLGDVVPGSLNQLVYGADFICEKLQIIQKGNTENYWILVRSRDTDRIHAIEVTSAGVSTTPVTSVFSPNPFSGVSASPMIGWFAVNPERNLLAEAQGLIDTALVRIYGFDNNTGVVTYGESIHSGTFGLDVTYGAAFSEDGNTLYSCAAVQGGNTEIFYWDVSQSFGSVAATKQSFFLAATSPPDYGGMARTNSGKIYMSQNVTSGAMTVINNPNNYSAPNIVPSGYTLTSGDCDVGVPNIPLYYHPSNFVDTLAGNDRTICSGLQTELGAIGYDSIWAEYAWEPAAMIEGNPNQATPITVVLTSDQEFIVHVVTACGDTIDSDTTMVLIGPGLNVNLNTNSPICEDSNLSLNASPTGLGAGNYTWVGPNGTFGGGGLSNVSIFPFPNPIPGGWYYVTANDNGCIGTDSAFVISNPVYNIIDTTFICYGDDFTYADGTVSTNITIPESHTSSLLTVAGCDSTRREYIQLSPTSANAGINGVLNICPNGSSTDLFTQLGGAPDFGGTWSPLLNSGTGIFDPNVDAAGTYFYVVSGGCGSDTASVQVAFNPLANSGTAGNLTICSTDPSTDLFNELAGTPDTGGSWSPTLNSGTGVFDPSIDTAGTYTYSVTNSCGSSTTNVVVTVNNNPDPGTNGTLSICDNTSSVDLINSLNGTPTNGGTWSPALNSGSGIFDPSIDAAGTYIYSVNMCGGGSLTAEVVVTLNPSPNSGSDGMLSLCNTALPQDLFTQLGGSPDAGGSWSPVLNSGTGIFDPFIDGAGAYTYSVINSCGTSSNEVVVTLVSSPNAGGDTSLTVCTNHAVIDLFNIIPNNPDTNGVWSNTSGDFDPENDNSGIITYTVSAVGCADDVTNITIVNNDIPILSYVSFNDNCQSQIGEIDLSVSGGIPPYSYNWGNGETSEDLFNLLGGNYTVAVSDDNGCSNNITANVISDEIDCQYHVYIPNTFTPNGDGQNDMLYVRGKGIQTLSFRLYNRWGNLVFETENKDIGWDGTLKEKDQSNAVFVYVLDVTYINGSKEQVKGNVTIVK